QYNIVIDTQQLLKSSIIMGLSGGKRKIALDGGREFSFIFANEIIKTHKKQFDVNYHVVNRNLEIAKYLGCQNPAPEFILPDFSKEYSSEIKNITERLDKTKKTITIAPATTWENKHWTVEGWQEVINYYCEKNNIIITASENEKVLTSKILEKISNKSKIIDLTGKTNLADLVYIFKISDLLITPDSGSAHIAWAVNHPKIVTLFFATSPNRNAPFGEKYKFIQSEIECSPCMKKKCRLKTDKIRCKKQIKPIEVINIVNEVLQ
ncbi:MAG: glycosyltransferase family 9 protein, partial [Candidatus Gastranaerophilales bacterium]|nr:glycosyltransferase family 9 protein [Candidatus Gastranaerophilales bacterium]